METLSKPAPIEEFTITAADEFAAMRARNRPAIMRDFAQDWMAVKAAKESDEALVQYFAAQANQNPVNAIIAEPKEQGRFFYTADLTKFNFVSGRGQFAAFLKDLIRLKDEEAPPALAVQSTPVDDIMPAFTQHNSSGFLPKAQPRIWLGNKVRVAPHYDVKENVAVCVAGRRRFTLFPPDQTSNLYPGPFEKTPAGTPVSMVDGHNPDLAQYPRYAEACEHALQATLNPADAIYIPYCWWHGVESLDPVSCLINYWWNETMPGIAGQYDALLHALAAFRHLPAEQRAVWKDMLNHYVFEEHGDPAEHLPGHAKGILGPASPELFAQMRQILRSTIN